MKADNIILFDGSCAFCNGFIRWILKIDRVRFRLCDQQSRQFSVIAQAHHLPLAAASNTGSIYLIQDGKAYARMAAVSRILRGCKLRYSMLGRLLQLAPPVASKYVFKKIAKKGI